MAELKGASANQAGLAYSLVAERTQKLQWLSWKTFRPTKLDWLTPIAYRSHKKHGKETLLV
jgi:hypothetical protein